VIDVEYWSSYSGRVVAADGRESTETYSISSVPADGDSIKVAISEGRWLLPEDHGAVVLTSAYTVDYPDVKVGDIVRIKVAGRNWT